MKIFELIYDQQEDGTPRLAEKWPIESETVVWEDGRPAALVYQDGQTTDIRGMDVGEHPKFEVLADQGEQREPG